MKNIRLFNVALLLVCLLCVPDSRAQDHTRLRLPEGAIARLGKGRINGTIAYSPDGTRLAAASNIGIWIYDAYTFAEIDLLLTGHTGAVTAVAFAPDGTTLISASDDRTIRLWEVSTGQLRATLNLKGHTGDIWSVAFAPDGRTLAIGNRDGTVRLWDVDTGQLKTTFTEVWSVAFAPDGHILAGGSTDGTVRLWDVNTGQLKITLIESEHQGGVRFVAFAPDGHTLASGSADRTVWLWDVNTGQLKATLDHGHHGHTDNISEVAFSPDGGTLASGSWDIGSWDGTILLWDVDSGQLKTYQEEEHQQDSISVELSPNGSTPKRTTFPISVQVTSLAFSPDGSTLASGHINGWGTIRLQDVGTGQIHTTLKNPDHLSSVAFSPDGHTLAIWGGMMIQLWDADSDQLKASLEGHMDAVYSVSFSPDGKTLASGSEDRTVRLWDVGSGQLHTTLKGHTHYVSSVAFSPDGKTLASGSRDATILLWDVSPYITPVVPTAIQSSPLLPTQTALLANFPNPFNPDTWIPYQLHAPAQVRLTIYDIRGALVREINLGYRAAGQYLTSTSAAHWDGRNQRGQRVSSGVYLYRLQAGPVAKVHKMVLVK